jgi:abequosyltransferase
VEGFFGVFPRLRYYRQDFKGGIDKDMAKSVELARGEYCWLFSADDVMAEGALDRILKKIRTRMDLYLCGFTRCTIDMKPVTRHPILKFASDAEFDLGKPADRMSYFSRALTTTAFFSYMSSLVLRKDRWDSAGPDDAFMGSCWGHAARIFRMVPDGLKVDFLPGD